jgi:hypothetical protein
VAARGIPGGSASASASGDLTTVKAAPAASRYQLSMDQRDARPPRRLEREEKTIAAMIALYCRDHHAGTTSAVGDADASAAESGDGLCPVCSELLDYARLRLQKCRYGAGKPTCANCETHCYRPVMRERVRIVMRYSGPRMLMRHPVLAVAHLVDGRKTPIEE